MSTGFSRCCELCKEGPFEGSLLWNQHVESDTHKANYILQYTTQQNKQCYCDSCNFSTNNQRKFEEHLASLRHRIQSQEAGVCETGSSNLLTDSTPHQVGKMSRNTEQYDKCEVEYNGDYGCSLCRVIYTSEASAIQHLKGEKHRKTKANTQYRTERSMSHELRNCNACGLVFDNAVSAEHHFSSESHRRRFQASMGLAYHGTVSTASLEGGIMDKAPEDSYYPQENLVNLKPHSPRDTSQRAQGSLDIEQQMQMLDLEIEEEVPHLSRNAGAAIRHEEYTFNGCKGFCNVCNIELTSKAHADQHLQGQKHRKAREKFGNVPANQAGPQLHSPIMRNTEYEGTPRQCSPVTSPGKAISPDKEYEWYGNRGRCNLCELELTSQQHAQQHLSGKNHQKRKTRGTLGVVVDTQLPLYCNVCEKPFTGPESAAQHYASAKHKQRAGVAADQNQGGMRALDRYTNWVTCTVCNCQLNSPEQLEIHKASPKHKSEEEKKLRRMQSPQQGPIGQQQPVWPKHFGLSRSPNLQMSPVPGACVSNSAECSPVKPQGKSENLPDVVQFEDSLCKEKPQPLDSFVPHSLDLEQLTLNLSQGFLFNKISFGELCPEVSQTSARDASVAGSFVGAHETAPKSTVSEIASRVSKDATPTGDLNTYVEDKAFPEKESLGLGVPSKVVRSQNSFKQSELRASESTVTAQLDSSVYITADEGQGHMEGSSSSWRSTDHDLDQAEKNSPLVSETTSRYNLGHKMENKTSGQGHFFQGDLNFPTFSPFSPENSHHSTERITTASKVTNPEGQDDNGDDLAFGSKFRSESPHLHHQYYCKTCQRQMNSYRSYNDHMTGRGHMQKVAIEPALPRSHYPLLKIFENYERLTFDLTKTVPRGYQCELMSKAMQGDTVIFLPTGTGKTLISCMVVSAMLTQNPTRQVVFLVDKVLLVIQQSRYLINELGDRTYLRFNADRLERNLKEYGLVERKLTIAALCGGQQSTGGVPLWKHDVIIATAAFYENLINRNILLWSDLSLVVFDEAHHCIKNHPFNKLLRGYHLTMDPNERPKLLGLTASPAGRNTMEATLTMLQQFMSNMGDTHMAIVERNLDELRSYQSNAEVTVMTAESSKKEMSFLRELQLYLLQCYMRFCAETDMLEQCNLGLSATARRNLTEQDRILCAQTLEGDLLNSLEVTLDKASPKNNDSAHRLLAGNLATHIKYLCYALNSLLEAGIPAATEEIQVLMATRDSSGFEFARGIGLNCDRLLSEFQACQEMEFSPTNRRLMTSHDSMSSKIECLVNCLLNSDNITWRQREAHPMALVLVKQRSTARMVCELLQSESKVKSHGLSVVYVVGHGTGSSDGGMTVGQQRRLLEEVKAYRHHIIVATSVAEEGIDIPECQLVVSMNPPSTVTALVQMRGRARKVRSKFVIICTDADEKAKLEELQLKENNMVEATAIVVQQQQQHGRQWP